MKRYLNTRTEYGVETIDVLDSEDFKSSREFAQELRRLREEYTMSGSPCWVSRRATKEWYGGTE